MNTKNRSLPLETIRQVKTLSHTNQSLRMVELSVDFKISTQILWDALTKADKLERWFQPVAGDLRLNGRFQIENNASGVVESCEEGQYFSLTWEFSENISWVRVSFTQPSKGLTRLTVSHTMNFSDHWLRYGPGATGVGWELSIYALAEYLKQPEKSKFDELAFVSSPTGRQLVEHWSLAWAKAGIASGTDSGHALDAANRTTAFYLGES